MNRKTKTLATMGMLCVLAFAATAVGRVPLVLFLKYDPKDVVIAMGGLIFGPFAAFVTALLVSLAEMFTISENGFLGMIMNVISSCSFACTAAWIYQRRRRLSGAVAGLLSGWVCMVAVMLLWNYFITPVYMGLPRQEVASLLLPAFLPFNLVKGGLNAALTMLLYKPVVTALRRSHLLEARPDTAKTRLHIGVVCASLLVLVSCVLLVLALQGAL